jgi:hypothetical protein
MTENMRLQQAENLYHPARTDFHAPPDPTFYIRYAQEEAEED